MDDHDFLPGNGVGIAHQHLNLDDVIGGMKSRETYGPPEDWKLRVWQNSCLSEFRRKHRAAGGNYFTFLVSAGVGSGKTMMAAMVASYLLNARAIDRIVYVCPNRTILHEVRKNFAKLNIAITPWDDDRRDREPSDSNGLIVTYQKLIHDHAKMGRLCDDSRTLVIFDEIHHLGDKLSWSSSARGAFEFRAKCVLGLSGTPYRSDNREIPFVTYEAADDDGLRTFRADYVYTLGQSVLDGVCRMPVVRWLDGDVKITLDDKTQKVVDWSEELEPHLQNRRLRAAVRHGSIARRVALQMVVEKCSRANRKLIIFVGGDSRRRDGGGILDATEYLPAELRAIGVDARDICSVASNDETAHDRIKEFGESGARILVTVNMVSEGVDITQLSAALFLTSITARSTTIQRIGRTLRGDGESWIWMFRDPRYMAIAREITTEIRYLIDMGKVPIASVPSLGVAVPGGESDLIDIGLTCFEGGETLNKVYYPSWVRERYEREILDRGLPEVHAMKCAFYPLIVEGKFGPVPTA